MCVETSSWHHAWICVQVNNFPAGGSCSWERNRARPHIAARSVTVLQIGWKPQQSCLSSAALLQSRRRLCFTTSRLMKKIGAAGSCGDAYCAVPLYLVSTKERYFSQDFSSFRRKAYTSCRCATSGRMQPAALFQFIYVFSKLGIVVPQLQMLSNSESQSKGSSV